MSKKILVTSTDLMMVQFLVPHVINLTENGYSVDIACSNVGGRIDEIKDKLKGFVDNIFVVSLQRSPLSAKNVAGFREMKKILSDNHYDLIWTNEPVMGVVTRLAAKETRTHGSKVMYMVHGLHFFKGAPLPNWVVFYPIEKYMSRYCDVITTINHEDYDMVNTFHNEETRYVHGIGANSGKFYVMSEVEKQLLRNELNIEDDTKVILNVGELNVNKNQKSLIRAMKIVVENEPNCKLFIAGKGDEYDNLKHLISELDLDNYVTLLGYTTEVYKYMNACNLLVACSYREGLPLNLMEAMLCGKPIVASKNRGHNELVKDGKNGFLVEAEDYKDYADKILMLLKDSSSFEKEAIEYVQPFKIDSVKDEINSLIESIIGR